MPDICLYVSALQRFVQGHSLEQLVIRSPFLLRSVEVEPTELSQRCVVGVTRLGKRLVMEFDNDCFVVMHLMIAGRLHWRKPGTLPRGKLDLAAFHFENGSLLLTEASSQKRAGLWIVRGRPALQSLHTPGVNPLLADFEAFRVALIHGNHTLKRALTDPNRFDGIGNAYSDEILHAARLSPLLWTSRLQDEELQRLWIACRSVLQQWIDKLAKETGNAFPEKVTAFRPDMAVHGKFKMPCPVCKTPVQRICYSDRECNYCPDCQTGGKLLADRSLSRLLKDDWPKTLEGWEAL
jgi:formamidopyrimidine-DNA glycosylase